MTIPASWPSETLDDLLPKTVGALLVVGRSHQARRELVAALAGRWRASGPTWILDADPGQPGIGPPMCVSLHEVTESGKIETRRTRFVGTLDPARHQGCYVGALTALAPTNQRVVVDASGVVRGAVAAELQGNVCAALGVLRVVLLDGDEDVRRFGQRLWGPFDIHTCPDRAHPRGSSRVARRSARTRRWQRAVGEPTCTRSLPDDELVRRAGVPHDASLEARLVAAEDLTGDVVMLGVVHEHAEGIAHVTMSRPPETNHESAIRYVVGNAAMVDGDVRTVDPSSHTTRPRAPSWTLRNKTRWDMRIGWPQGAANAQLQPRFLGGLFDDPALLLRNPRSGDALMFDVGWFERVPTRVLHQVSAIFVSHCHMDHTQGLVTLLRTRVGPGGGVSLYGPPTLASRVTALVEAFEFNLLTVDAAPWFDVHHREGDSLVCTRIHATTPPTVERHEPVPIEDDIIACGPDWTVRSRQLDHRIPVMGYRLDVVPFGGNEEDTRVLSYVTDVADTPYNRECIIALARDADLFVCEARFTQEHRERALKTAHLTATSTAELARDAGVTRLVPFHLSSRYEEDPALVFDEVRTIFSDIQVPHGL